VITQARNAMLRTIAMHADERAIFGYGSLLLKRSMEKTLGRAYRQPLAICGVRGWRRSWDAFMPNAGKYVDESGIAPANIIYLNVRPASGALLNGVLYVVPQAAMTDFDSREWVYGRIEVTELLSGVEVRGGNAWMYAAKPEFVVAQPRRGDYAIRQTYIDVVQEGLRELGQEFRDGYRASTDVVPAELVIRDVQTSGDSLHFGGT